MIEALRAALSRRRITFPGPQDNMREPACACRADDEHPPLCRRSVCRRSTGVLKNGQPATRNDALFTLRLRSVAGDAHEADQSRAWRASRHDAPAPLRRQPRDSRWRRPRRMLVGASTMAVCSARRAPCSLDFRFRLRIKTARRQWGCARMAITRALLRRRRAGLTERSVIKLRGRAPLIAKIGGQAIFSDRS